MTESAKIQKKVLQKTPTGIQGFDEITGGGLPFGRPTLICGDAGCGKTLFSMEFLVRGATKFNDPGVFMSFEETETELTANVASLGFDLAKLVDKKKIILDHVHIERSEIQETGEYDLEVANRQLKETNTTKDKLFSIIAHDLRAPFTVLLGFSELLGRNAQNYDTGHFELIVSNIQSAARSAFELLENLFLWATAQKKQLNYNPETTDLTEILQELTRNARTIAVTKNISVNCIPAEKLMVFADVNMLKVILHNLINNAIKFTYPGGQIEIRASLGKKSVEISISDNGMGMSKEKIRHLFNIEANKTSSGTANEKGTGLGLLICKEFIEMHKGNLLIQSKVGKGSTFTVVFPQPEVVNKKTGVKTPLQKHQKRRQVG